MLTVDIPSSKGQGESWGLLLYPVSHVVELIQPLRYQPLPGRVSGVDREASCLSQVVMDWMAASGASGQKTSTLSFVSVSPINT